MIAKLADSKYDGRRSPNWLKFKCVRDQEFVVGGYTSPKGSRIELGALLIGYYDGGDLVYAGKVGTGFDEATLRNLHERLSGIERDAPPFTRGLVRERERAHGYTPSWWPRSGSASGRATASCATRATKACAPTRSPATLCGRHADAPHRG